MVRNQNHRDGVPLVLMCYTQCVRCYAGHEKSWFRLYTNLAVVFFILLSRYMLFLEYRILIPLKMRLLGGRKLSICCILQFPFPYLLEYAVLTFGFLGKLYFEIVQTIPLKVN